VFGTYNVQYRPLLVRRTQVGGALRGTSKKVANEGITPASCSGYLKFDNRPTQQVALGNRGPDVYSRCSRFESWPRHCVRFGAVPWD